MLEKILSEYDLYISYFIIEFFTFVSSSYLFFKSQNTRPSKKSIVLLLITNTVLSLFITIIYDASAQLTRILSYFFISVILSLCVKGNKTKLIEISFISISFVHILKWLSLFISSILWLLSPISQSIFTGIIGLLIVGLSVLFMNIRRFRKGFQFFQRDENLGLGIAISGFVFILSSIDSTKDYISDIIFMIMLFGIFISGFGIYLWIRKSINTHYREKLQLKSEEHYKAMLDEKEKYLEQLLKSNQYLSKVVHRDNHLMSALDFAIGRYLETESDAEKEQILREIQILSKERGELIRKEQLESKILPSTGNLLIDSALNDMYVKAAARGINFILSVSEPVNYLVNNTISQTELQTLLCDHIKDAIIAIEHTDNANGRIMVSISMNSGIFDITVNDNGIDFEPYTLARLGIERTTTHTESGGSGIGFMTTFKTLQNCRASLIITEYENKTPFSKSVSFRFDGENRFIISSPRKELLKKIIKRDDVVIY